MKQDRESHLNIDYARLSFIDFYVQVEFRAAVYEF